jgi:predicted DNA-binding protein YlxM (UPF0122 family)
MGLTDADLKDETMATSMNLLADYYGSLLPERQAEIFRSYYGDNLSLTEIAEELGVSKQAVSGMLRKARITLENYETELGMIAKHRQYLGVLADIDALIYKGRKNRATSPGSTVKGLAQAKRLVEGLEL